MTDENRPLKEFERKQLLERIEREAATVGASIPAEITIQGNEIELQQFVFEIRRRETVPPGEHQRVERAKKNLRRERLQRKQRIETGEITRAEADRLVTSIIGIDRALTELDSLGPANVEAEATAQETADQKRWMRFLKQALGHSDEDTGHGVSGGSRR